MTEHGRERATSNAQLPSSIFHFPRRILILININTIRYDTLEKRWRQEDYVNQLER